MTNGTSGTPWTPGQNAAAVTAYLRMLRQDLAGIRVVKTREYERLAAELGRSPGSVQNKFQNISAVLDSNGWIFIKGLNPRRNKQETLDDEVFRQLRSDNQFDDLTRKRVTQLIDSAIQSSPVVAELKIVEPPQVYSNPSPWQPRRSGMKRDYAIRDANNRALGRKGEELVVAYERSRLERLGLSELACRVRHVSVDDGDGFGYDVESFEDTGRKRFIEVKTTVRRAQTPFFLSRNELAASSHYGDKFHLYRIFGFGTRNLGMYQLHGPLKQNCDLTEETYSGLPRPDKQSEGSQFQTHSACCQ